MALPMMNTALEEARLFAGADEVVTALEFAQLTALSTGRPCKVIIDAAADIPLLSVEQIEYGVDFMGTETELDEVDVETEAYAPMAHPLKLGTDYNINFGDDPRFEGVTVVSAVFGADNFVVFDALGAPSTGGSVTLAFRVRQVVLNLDALSGRVTRSN